MAVVTEIPWNDGSGDKIYLTRNASEGGQVVAVTSDVNTGDERSQVITFTSIVGSIARTLTITQEAGGPVEHTFTAYLSSYDQSNSVFGTLNNESRAYGGINTSKNWYADITLKTGSRAETFFYYLFDLSDIPQNATIVSVSINARAAVSSSNTNYVASKSMAVCRGTTIIGTETAITGTATTYTLDCGTGWTGENIQELKLLLYGKRGTSRTTNAYGLWCYGARITVKYTV